MITSNDFLLKIESIILEQDNIKNCTFLIKKTELDRKELVGYIVPFSNRLISEEILQKSLQGIIPSELILKSFISINQMPLTQTGEVDGEKLLPLEVIDRQLIENWERELSSVDPFDKVAVVIDNHQCREIRIHLKDIICGGDSPANKDEITSISGRQKTINNHDFAGEYLALVRGENLIDFKSQKLKNLSQLLLDNADKYQQNNLVYIQNNNDSHAQSYFQLLEEAQKILTGLKKLGLKPQDKVIFQLDLNRDIVAAFWGCILGGFIPIIIENSLNSQEKSNLVAKIAYIWELLHRPLIITREKGKKLSKWLSAGDLPFATLEQLSNNPPTTDYHDGNPDEIALFNFTSGSTGKPKCIPLTHRNLITRALATNQLCQHHHRDIILNWLPFEHIGSISDWHIRPLALGCTLVYASKEYIIGNPLNWLNLIDKYRVTHSWAPNFAYALINETLEGLKRQPWDLSCLISLLSAGEAIAYATIADFCEKLAPYGLKSGTIKPAFGMAETGSGITYYQPEITGVAPFVTVDKASLPDIVKPANPNDPESVTFANVGSVIPNMSMRIVDRQNSLLPKNKVGRVQVKGDALFQGYYRHWQENEEVFTEDGWFNTGDLGFITEENLVVTGREKETIIINGVNYYPQEIETLIEELEGIEVSYTAACSVKPANEFNEQLAIFFHPRRFEGNFLVKLIARIKNQLATKLGITPAYFIPLNQQEIPKTAIGKIQRSQLQKSFESGSFDGICKQIDLLLANERTISDWFYQKKWRAYQPHFKPDKISFGRTLIFVDELGLGNSLAQKLEATEGKCIEVVRGVDFQQLDDDRYQINPVNPEHYQLLLGSILDCGIPIAQIFQLWTHTGYIEIDSLEQLERSQEQILGSILLIVQTIAQFQPEQPLNLFVAGNYTQAADPTDKIAIAKTSLLGLLKTIPQEMPWLNCRHIDLPIADIASNSDCLLQEISLLSKDREVAYRQGVRLIPRLEKVDWQQKSRPRLPFKPGGIYLIAGGLGGIGVEIAKYLLKNYRARLILLGRTNLPERSQWDNYRQEGGRISAKIEAYEELEELAGEIDYHAVDICNLEHLKSLWHQIKAKWQQPIAGVINLAGIYRESWLAGENINDLMGAIAPKVSGSWILHQLVKNEWECELIHFSSIASFFGGATLASYSAANAFLEGFSCYQNQQTSLKSYCYSWSGWQGIGINKNSASESLSKARGYYSISPQQGINSLLAALSNNLPHLLIGLDGCNPNVSHYLEIDSPHPTRQLTAYYTTKDRDNGDRPIPDLDSIIISDRFGTPSNCQLVKIEQMPLTKEGKIDRQKLIGNISFQEFGQIVTPRNDLEKEIAKIWQDILKLEKPIDVYDNFFELGGDSVKATMLINKIKQEIGGDLSVASLFEMPTINQLALSLNNINVKEEISDEDLLAEVLAEVNQLSDQEITYKLREME